MYCVQTSLKMKRSRILSVALSNIPTRTAIMVFALSVGHIDNTRGADTIRNFKVKLDNKHLRTGIFVAPNGIADGNGDIQVYGTNGQIDMSTSRDKDSCVRRRGHQGNSKLHGYY